MAVFTRLFSGVYVPPADSPYQEQTPYNGIYTTDPELFSRIIGQHPCYAARQLRERRQRLATMDDELLGTTYVHFRYKETPIVDTDFAHVPIFLGRKEPSAIREHLRSLGEVTGKHVMLVYTYANRFGSVTALECEIPPAPQRCERAYKTNLREELVASMIK